MSISVSRTIVVRVHQALDEIGCKQLDRIVANLIDNRDVADLILDLSQVGHIDQALKAVLDTAQTRIEELGGVLELRTPAEPPVELLEMTEEIPTFAPIEAAD